MVGKIMKGFMGLRPEIYIFYMTIEKIKKQTTQESVSSKENLSLKIIKTI